jgi:CMP-N,N'-diacetyllegionaminic acid synthase
VINGQSVLAIVPARGGSKGLPGKNIHPVGGRPLIGWSFAAASQSRFVDRCILSSDDAEIIAVARKLGCDVPFVRPSALAGDEARIEDAVIHSLDSLREIYDLVVLLQPTSPLRTAEDIDSCIEQSIARDAPSAVSVCLQAKSPYWMYEIGGDQRLVPILPPRADGYRRQNLPPIFALNGAVYVSRVPVFRSIRKFVTAETIAYVMPPERSVDVDTVLDMALVSILLDKAIDKVVV